MRSLKSNLFRRSQSENDQPHWLPDQSLPYVIHHPGRDPKDEVRNPLVCIWPRVRHVTTPNQEYDVLEYMLNREHGCVGRILRKSETSIVFEDIDGHFDHVAVTIAVMTDDEFEVIKGIYEENRWPELQTKEDLVKIYIEGIDD